ncbi:hypothetical protein BD626DRAFT_502350 [Schizophyllum amplum]|uniref:F-box domain-containing protein n=1 Tax=Schizophyllum amplum TaxID=97359 RepID=A0A550C9B7_9AGAR|nr:hypothetical protein BD626DRAFT_502350 [Auriculariopsis ampla]
MRTSDAESAMRTSAAESTMRTPDAESAMRTSDAESAMRTSDAESAMRTSDARTPDTGNALILSRLPSLPLDILYEILASLHPLDLLHLSRTTKTWRVIVLGRSATSAWTRSFSSQIKNRPSIPDDISIPRLTSLMFEPFCQYCHTHTSEVSWECRVRVCQQCVDLHYLWTDPIPDAEPDMYLKIHEICPESCTFASATLPFKLWRHATETLRQIWDEYLQLKDDDAAVTRWLDAKKAQKAEIVKHALECAAWVALQDNVQ